MSYWLIQKFVFTQESIHWSIRFVVVVVVVDIYINIALFTLLYKCILWQQTNKQTNDIYMLSYTLEVATGLNSRPEPGPKSSTQA